MSEADLSDIPTGVAIIGMSGRFPGANTLDDFWRNLCDGVESVSFFSDDEALAAGGDPALLHDPAYVKARAIIDGIELFDAAFFGYTPREAEVMDPQQRMFLECAWAALEHAGYDSESGPETVSVFAGAAMNYYMLANLYPNRRMLPAWGELQSLIGNDKDHLSTRVSYKLNLKGSSVTVQTACSTGLVAVCMACQSLLDYQCDLALAGGVSLGIPQKFGYYYSEGGIGSPDGHCRAFDAEGRGTVGGDGVGAVVLKRLDDALADGDTIHAVILGFGTNNDGSDKVGYTAPSVSGQAQAISAAHEIAGIDPATISYVEAHGTATTLGDPIEIAALTQAFRKGTDATGFCAIGSVKTNIGHLNTAAGIAGLIKTVLALKHKRIPPSLHFRAPNPQIDFANSPFYVNSRLSAWRAGPTPRRAGVSSFGMGGTNAHVVLQEAPPDPPAAPARPWQILTLSARSASALEAATDNLAEYLAQPRAAALADIAHTLQVGRRAFEHRRALVCRDAAEARQALAARDPRLVWTRRQDPIDRTVAFLFPGQGSQYAGMGRELYESEPAFREQIDRCAEILRPQLGLDLRDALWAGGVFGEGQTLPQALSPYSDRGGGEATGDETDPSSFVLRPSSDDEGASSSDLARPGLALPALFAVEYALAQLWMAWGVRPAAMIGHSFGEYVAACLAGVFTLEEGLALAATRGRLMEEMPDGAMLSVALPAEDLRPLLGPRVEVAAINGPALCVVAGPAAAIGELERALAAQGVEARRLHAESAPHTALVEPILDRFSAFVRTLRLRAPRLPYISSVSGTWITAAQATDPEYWAAHLRRPVRFADGLAALLEDPSRALLEVGPGRALASLARIQAPPDRIVLHSLPHPHDPQPADAFLMGALAQLWLAGARVDWRGFAAREQRRRVPLPTYPFERVRYWIEADPRRVEDPQAGAARLGMDDWFAVPSWKRSTPPEPDEAADEAGWLIFRDPAGIGTALLDRLRAQGRHAISVEPGEAFARIDERSYRIRPADRADYAALLADLGSAGPLPRLIVHLWALARPADELAAAELPFYSLLYLAQALGGAGDEAPRRIAIVSDRLYSVLGDEDLAPAQATLLGPCLTLPQEYAGLSCRNIDIALPAAGAGLPDLLRDQILDEAAADAPDRVVAYRGPHRWVQTTEPLRLAPAPHPHPRLRERGVYLITGGLGGMGLTFAGYLARTVRARLALTTRADPPPRAEWDAWLARAGADDPLAPRLRAARELEAHGAEVIVLRADAADEAQLRAAIEGAEARFGSINGVIHAAGVPGGGLAQIKTRAAADATLAPKLRGALALDRALRERPLDFLALCSSLTGLLGGIGQIDYCAANAFLDALAQRRTLCDGSWTVAIDWDGWREVGMAVASRREQPWAALLPEDGAPRGMSPDQGAETLARILASRRPIAQVIVSTTDMDARVAEARELTQARAIAALGRADAPVRHARPDLATAYAAPTTDLERWIAQVWGQALGIERVGVHDDFFALGGHSLLMAQVVARILGAFGVEVPIHSFFQNPTVAGLALKITELRVARHDAESTNGLLDQLDQLSAAELQALLGQPAAPAGEAAPARHARPDLATAYAAPATDLERRIAELWSQALGIERVGVHDDFFALGGHSLMAVQILARLRSEFQVELSLPALFRTPTIADLAEAIDTLRWASADLHAPHEAVDGYTQGEI